MALGGCPLISMMVIVVVVVVVVVAPEHLSETTWSQESNPR